MSQDHSYEGVNDLSNAASLIKVAVDCLTAFRQRTGHYANPSDKHTISDTSLQLVYAERDLRELRERIIARSMETHLPRTEKS